jgi:hypothetical protein
MITIIGDMASYGLTIMTPKSELEKMYVELFEPQNSAELAATDNQQIKPKMPSYSEVAAICRSMTNIPNNHSQFSEGFRLCYDIIARHFGH